MNVLEAARKDINDIDRAMAELFEKRMRASAVIGEYKKANSIGIRDKARETEMEERSSLYIKDETLREYYRQFLRACIDISCAYQQSLTDSDGERK